MNKVSDHADFSGRAVVARRFFRGEGSEVRVGNCLDEAEAEEGSGAAMGDDRRSPGDAFRCELMNP